MITLSTLCETFLYMDFNPRIILHLRHYQSINQSSSEPCLRLNSWPLLLE